MRVMINDSFTDGFLDYYCKPEEYRIECWVWKNLERLDGLYYLRDKNFWTLWNYLRDIGPRQTLLKVLSRTQERLRNEKYVACGVGRILAGPPSIALSAPQWVVFLAPCQPCMPERICLPAALIKPIKPAELNFPLTHMLCCSQVEDGDPWWAPIRAWSSYSGAEPPKDCASLMERVVTSLNETNWKRASQWSASRPSIVTDRAKVEHAPRAGKKTAVLFGYGNYAKNIILPQVKSHLDLRCIHEIDPLQIPQQRSTRYAWNTSPDMTEHEGYDVFLIAGFHHTHTPLACKALQRGADVLIEKPVAVDQRQLDDLVTAMRQANGRVFCCFHKRYQKFNEMARDDLQAKPGDPIHYHCSVYEAPLPPYHWYRWPNSKSRFITNGCHWLDHFLLLNNYAKATSWTTNVSPDKTAVNCSVSLTNGAFFTMVMTYQGSERIGPQDYIELRANGRTVQIANESSYFAESKQRILRRYGENRMKAYAHMYRRISLAIARGEAGDSIDSVKGAVELGLRLEESAASQT